MTNLLSDGTKIVVNLRINMRNGTGEFANQM